MTENEQRLSALEEANRRRLAAAAWKRSVRQLDAEVGLLAVADAIASRPTELGALRVGAMVGAVAGMGATRVRALIAPPGRSTGILTRRLRDVSDAEASYLEQLLAEEAESRERRRRHR